MEDPRLVTLVMVQTSRLTGARLDGRRVVAAAGDWRHAREAATTAWSLLVRSARRPLGLGALGASRSAGPACC